MTNWLMTWTVGGAEGIPIPYSPRMDDGITIASQGFFVTS